MARVLSLIFWLMPLFAAAQEDCDAILTLTQLQTALERVTAPGHRRVTADMTVVRRILLRADAANINYALRDHTLASQADAIADFLAVARTASDSFDAGQRNRTLNYLMSPEPRRIRITTGLMLRGYPCRGSSARVSTGLQQLTLDAPSPLDPVTFTRKQALATLGLSVALIPLCIYLIRRQIHRLALRRRRQRRHVVDIRAFLVASHRTQDIQNTQLWERAEVLDLSCEGAKIQHWSDLAPDGPAKITLMIDARAHPAAIIWANPHYAGIKFATKLDFRTRRKLVRDNPPRGRIIRPPRKPAPKPAAT